MIVSFAEKTLESFEPLKSGPWTMAGVGSSAPAKFRRGEVTVAREKLGETVRESSRICRWLRDEEWWPRATGPRRAAAGDGSVRQR